MCHLSFQLLCLAVCLLSYDNCYPVQGTEPSLGDRRGSQDVIIDMPDFDDDPPSQPVVKESDNTTDASKPLGGRPKPITTGRRRHHLPRFFALKGFLESFMMTTLVSTLMLSLLNFNSSKLANLPTNGPIWSPEEYDYTPPAFFGIGPWPFLLLLYAGAFLILGMLFFALNSCNKQTTQRANQRSKDSSSASAASGSNASASAISPSRSSLAAKWHRKLSNSQLRPASILNGKSMQI